MVSTGALKGKTGAEALGTILQAGDFGTSSIETSADWADSAVRIRIACLRHSNHLCNNLPIMSIPDL